MQSNFLERYLQHRQRVLSARPIIDNNAPKLHLRTVMNVAKMKEDALMYERIRQFNLSQLMEQNRIARTTGLIDTFPIREKSVIGPGKIKAARAKIVKQEKENLSLGQRILCSSAELSTRWPVHKDRQKKSQSQDNFKLPEKIFAKYKNLKLPPTKQLQQKLLRPKVYIDLAVKDVRPLGRISIQLYTEASPQVVLEFARICHAKSSDKVSLVRLFPSLWLEGELMLDVDSPTNKTIEYDMRALDHGKKAGILSFSNCFLKGFKRGYLNFSISFKPLRVLNGSRVAFGEVLSGMKILDCIQGYGTKNGKPTKQIIVTDCGIYQ